MKYRINIKQKLLLFGAIGHLICWLGGDLLLCFMPSGPLNVMGLFDYDKTVEMLQGVSPIQFTISGVFGVIAMMVVMPGYFQIANIIKPISKKLYNLILVAIAFICVSGAIMHFTCTSMLWHFVKAGATKSAHEIMISYFFETCVTSFLCNIGVMIVSITLFIMVFMKKTIFPKWACLINTLIFTIIASIIFAGMGAMNVGSCLMFFGLYFMVKKYNCLKSIDE